MKGRTLLTALLLSAILGASVYIPIEIFRCQDEKILKTVHTESLKEEEFQILDKDVLEKISFIASTRLADSKVSAATSNVSMGEEEMKVILLNAAEELQQLGIVSGVEYVGETLSIGDAWWVVYMNTNVKKSMSCYIITARNEQFSIWMQMDRATGKIYELSLKSEEQGIFALSDSAIDIWSEYLGISLEETTETYIDEGMYRIKNTSFYYRLSQSVNGVDIQILNSTSIGNSAAVQTDETSLN